MARDETRATRHDGPPSEATQKELYDEILRVAEELRSFGFGNQADRLQRVVQQQQDYVPTLDKLVTELAHPLSWPTRGQAAWLTRKLSEAVGIVEEMVLDAEITGSTDVLAQAKAWLDGIREHNRPR
jgi:hypothetical protein